MHIGRVSAVRGALHLAALLVSICLPLGAVAAQISPDTVFFWSVCKHDEVFNPSDIRCLGDSTSSLTTFRGQDVREYEVVMHLKNGRTYRQVLPGGTDAIFMSNHALQKFALPYYQSVNDQRKVDLIRHFLGRLDAASQQGRPSKPPARPEKRKP